MSYDIIVRFPDKDIADDWCAGMSDGFGEGFCDFSFWQQKPGTTGDNKDDYEKVMENGVPVYFVSGVYDD